MAGKWGKLAYRIELELRFGAKFMALMEELTLACRTPCFSFRNIHPTRHGTGAMGRTCPCHVNPLSISRYVLDPCGHVVGARIYSPRTSSGLVVDVVIVVASSSSLYINDDEWQGNPVVSCPTHRCASGHQRRMISFQRAAPNLDSWPVRSIRISEICNARCAMPFSASFHNCC